MERIYALLFGCCLSAWVSVSPTLHSESDKRDAHRAILHILYIYIYYSISTHANAFGSHSPTLRYSSLMRLRASNLSMREAKQRDKVIEQIKKNGEIAKT